MKSFVYTIKDKKGMHVRPVGKITEAARKYKDDAEITIRRGETVANATSTLELLSMHAKCGDIIVVTVAGTNEDNVFKDMRKVFEENL